jgi:hypothetical protein
VILANALRVNGWGSGGAGGIADISARSRTPKNIPGDRLEDLTTEEKQKQKLMEDMSRERIKLKDQFRERNAVVHAALWKRSRGIAGCKMLGRRG